VRKPLNGSHHGFYFTFTHFEIPQKLSSICSSLCFMLVELLRLPTKACQMRPLHRCFESNEFKAPQHTKYSGMINLNRFQTFSQTVRNFSRIQLHSLTARDRDSRSKIASRSMCDDRVRILSTCTSTSSSTHPPMHPHNTPPHAHLHVCPSINT
jgi:hypothetical protein